MRFRQGCRGFVLALLPIIFDRISKVIMMRMPQGAGFSAIPGILNFCYTRNYGAAFGFWGQQRPFLIAVAVLVSCAILFLLFRYPRAPKMFRSGLWLIFAGGFGNLFDRVFYGYVVDFLQFAFVPFPIFNMADMFITFGTIFAGASLLFSEVGEKKHG